MFDGVSGSKCVAARLRLRTISTCSTDQSWEGCQHRNITEKKKKKKKKRKKKKKERRKKKRRHCCKLMCCS